MNDVVAALRAGQPVVLPFDTVYGLAAEPHDESSTRRLYELERERQQAELDATRRSQIGSGGRAEKIRTYNFPENRITDHRIKLTTHQLDRVLQGELDEFTQALTAEERRRALGE